MNSDETHENLGVKNQPKHALRYHPSQHTKYAILRSMKSMTYETKSTTPNTRQRQRTVKTAIQFFKDEVSLRGNAKKDAIECIENAAQPMTEAKRIVKKTKRDSLGVKSRGEVEKSEVDNLYSAMMKKAGCLFPSDPHAMLFYRIDDLFLEGDLTREQFIKMSVAIMEMLKGLVKNKNVPDYSFREPTTGLSMGARKEAEQKALIARSVDRGKTITELPAFLDRRMSKWKDAAE
jgi:hypothetical protein